MQKTSPAVTAARKAVLALPSTKLKGDQEKKQPMRVYLLEFRVRVEDFGFADIEDMFDEMRGMGAVDVIDKTIIFDEL